MSSPADAVQGDHNSLFLSLADLGPQPSAGRLLRGLTPYLDEQGASHVFLFTERKWKEPWQASGASVPYQEIVHWARDAEGGVYRGVCCKGAQISREDLLQAFSYEPLGLIDWAARRLQAAVIASNQPLRLLPCEIPKPWGRELWLTGVESRGVSSIQSNSGATELPYGLGLFPVPILGEQEQEPVLLKVLEPFPSARWGDLYLEVHREKWEVYVVLEVDHHAWPDGVGALRAGFATEVVAEYQQRFQEQGPDRLKAELERRLNAYAAVREQLDPALETQMLGLRLEPGALASVAQKSQAYAQLPETLRQKEQSLLGAVHELLGLVPLRAGDVTCLPPGVLHSLMHGVSVVEFQTPTYERLIAMSSQKVLTQPQWDSLEAIRMMDPSPYAAPALRVISDSGTVRVERVVDFPQFQVERLILQPGSNSALCEEALTENKERQYRLLFILKGEGVLEGNGFDEISLKAGDAFLLPASLSAGAVISGKDDALQCLVAIPKETPPDTGNTHGP